jgi:hypothetical protein
MRKYGMGSADGTAAKTASPAPAAEVPVADVAASTETAAVEV